jgi:hypothetical protein
MKQDRKARPHLAARADYYCVATRGIQRNVAARSLNPFSLNFRLSETERQWFDRTLLSGVVLAIVGAVALLVRFGALVRYAPWYN